MNKVIKLTLVSIIVLSIVITSIQLFRVNQPLKAKISVNSILNQQINCINLSIKLVMYEYDYSYEKFTDGGILLSKKDKEGHIVWLDYHPDSPILLGDLISLLGTPSHQKLSYGPKTSHLMTLDWGNLRISYQGIAKASTNIRDIVLSCSETNGKAVKWKGIIMK